MERWKLDLQGKLQTVHFRALASQLSRQEKVLRATRFLEDIVYPAVKEFAAEISRYRFDCTVSEPTSGDVKLIVYDQRKSPPLELFNSTYKIQAEESSVTIEIYVSIEELPEPLAEIWLTDNYDPDKAFAVVIDPLLRFFPTALMQMVTNRDYQPPFGVD